MYNDLGTKKVEFKKVLLVANKNHGWDWSIVDIGKKMNVWMITTKPSVIQHIGISGLNSSSRRYHQRRASKNQSQTIKEASISRVNVECNINLAFSFQTNNTTSKNDLCQSASLRDQTPLDPQMRQEHRHYRHQKI